MGFGVRSSALAEGAYGDLTAVNCRTAPYAFSDARAVDGCVGSACAWRVPRGGTLARVGRTGTKLSDHPAGGASNSVRVGAGPRPAPLPHSGPPPTSPTPVPTIWPSFA